MLERRRQEERDGVDRISLFSAAIFCVPVFLGGRGVGRQVNTLTLVGIKILNVNTTISTKIVKKISRDESKDYKVN